MIQSERDFNSHAHVERDMLRSVLGQYIVYFNSHAHVERDEIISAIIDGFKDFNSHAHVERDSEEQYRYIREHISTHTLTWSVTVYFIALAL